MPHGRNNIISIIDDDADIVCLFFDALSVIRGVRKYKFTDPKLALEHFKYNGDSYSLIISDNRMPGISGLELLQTVKKMNPNVRTVLLTAFDIDDVIFKEKNNHVIVDSFLQKPIRIPEFVQEIKKQLNLSKMNQNVILSVPPSLKSQS